MLGRIRTVATALFTIFIDGLCPLCVKEAGFMRRLDRGRGRLCIIDIAAGDFDPSTYGRSMDEFMGSIHGLTADGRLITGMEVFRRAYGAVGWGWVLAPTGWPVLRPVFDAVYRWFARNRLRLTGRSCEGDRCVPFAARPGPNAAAPGGPAH